MLSGGLSIGFQATENTLTIVVGEEFRIVWEVVDEPIAGDADEYGGETFLCR
jgi:hypothetical protein